MDFAGGDGWAMSQDPRCASLRPASMKTTRTLTTNGATRIASMVHVEPRHPHDPRMNRRPVDGCEGTGGRVTRTRRAFHVPLFVGSTAITTVPGISLELYFYCSSSVPKASN